MSQINQILNRISYQSNEIIDISNKPMPAKDSLTVKAALGLVDILDYLRDADASEVRLFRSQQQESPMDASQTDKLVTRTIQPPTPLRVKPQAGKEFDINVLLNAAMQIIDDYRPLPRTKQHIQNLKTQVEQARENITQYQRIIDSPLDSNINQIANTLDTQADADSPQELIRVQTEQVKKMQAKVMSLKRRKEVLQATVKAHKLEAQSKTQTRQAPPTPMQYPLRQMKEIQRRANTPRKPKLAADRREVEIMKGLPIDAEDSFKMGNEDTLNTSTLLSSTAGANINLMPSTPMAMASNANDMLMDMDTPQPQSRAPPKQPQFEPEQQEDSIDLTMRKPTPPSSPEFEPPPKLKDLEKTVSTTPKETPKEKTPLPPPSPSPVREATPAIELTPEIEAALKVIWNGFGDFVKPKADAEVKGANSDTVPDLDRMLELLKNAVDSVPAASAQEAPGSPTHSILSIASSMANSREANNPQTALSAALISKLLCTPENKLSMQDGKDHLAQVVKSKGWSEDLTTKSIYGLVGKRVLLLERKGASATLRFKI
ncbi:hypothetical protein E3P99_00413 [Wallemia hederae]|uniref:Uncharacterized protein n=1 Tax=Wallemia hederae TaxID=1540922 RepID=A0A4T0FWY1_9BASI|nr:hypothetical protein E3P99_00413 [Wallemia hederae]